MCACKLRTQKTSQNILHARSWHQRIKGLFVCITYACMVLVSLEGCHRGAVAPNPDETEIETVMPNLGGIPNLGNTCYMNAVLQIIAKLYPNVFSAQGSNLAKAGQVIVDKIKDDKGDVIGKEAEAFYTALLEEAKGKFTRDTQEGADECMEVIWQHLSLPAIDDVLCTPYITLGLRHPRDNNNTGRPMPDLLDHYASSATISSINFLNDIIPIKLNRLDTDGRALIMLNTVVQQALKLTITKTHIPALSRNMCCRLDGVIVHLGSETRGHYFTYINRNGQWKLYDDARVEKVTPAQAEEAAKSAYLYFYSKVS